MAQQINVEITVNGKKIEPFSHLSLRQAFNEHHYFEFRFNYDVLEARGAMNIEKTKDYLGKPVTISLNDIYSPGAANTFKGIVTDVRFFNTLDAPRDIVFSGYSPTILLDAGETNSSHMKRTLTQMVKDVSVDVASNQLNVKTQPVKTSAIPYTVQYRESNFEFIRRLAAEYGEHFFYDGAALNFGKPAGGALVSLTYPNHISDMNLRVKVAPVSSDEIAYLSKTDKKEKAAGGNVAVAGLDTFGKFALKESENIFKSKSTTLSPRKLLEKSELDESVKIAKSRQAAALVQLSAKSDWPFVKIGGTVQVKTHGVDGDASADYGKYMVTSIMHKTDGLGNYENEFEAIPETVAVAPNPYGKKPMAEPQIGIVTDLKDPDNMGKVKVKLMWQEGEATTPYLRVLTPNAGVYGDGSKKTRGHFFTPEVNDYVVVGFTQNDPDRPFVMGALPHGKAISSSESTEKNNVKSISTRNGNIISFTDKDKENIIKIQTDDTNYISIHLKDKDGTVQIFSSKVIEVNSKESIIVKSGDKIEVQGDKTISVKSEKITIEATDTITLKANKKVEIKAADVTIEGTKGFEAKGGATAKVEGAQLELKGSATAKVNGGAQLELQGGAMASLKGGIVQIN